MKARRSQSGFTMIEVMVAMLLTAIAIVGIIGLYRVQTRSSSYSRRSTEAAILAGDKMEVLRATKIPASSTTPETVDANGVVGSGPFTREWTVTNPSGTQYEILVEVSWSDDGTTRTVPLRSVRTM